MTWNGSGTNTIVTVIQGTNELTNSLIGLFFLIIVFGIVYFGSGGEPTREKFTGASFVTMLVAILLNTLGMVTGAQLAGIVVIFIGALVMLVNK